MHEQYLEENLADSGITLAPEAIQKVGEIAETVWDGGTPAGLVRLRRHAGI